MAKALCIHGRYNLGKGPPCSGGSTATTDNLNGGSKFLKIRKRLSVVGAAPSSISVSYALKITNKKEASLASAYADQASV